MKRIKLYIAMSLDGYIATTDGDIKWLSMVEGEGDNGYFAFFSSIDTVVMGRLTYEWILKNNTYFPYAQQKCYVVTSQKMPSIGNVYFIEGSFQEMSHKLRHESEKDICLIGGAQLFDGFLKLGEVDDLVILIAPIVLGEGIRLFTDLHEASRWQLTKTTTYNQFVEITYKKWDKNKDF